MKDLTLQDMNAPLIHAVDGVENAGLKPPRNRHGQSVRAWIRSLNGIQKEGVTLSALTGRAWRFASDEGPHLGGFDDAPNPLSFVSVGMVGSIMTELLALARQRRVELENPVLTLENFYFRDGSFPRGTMVSGALPPEVSLSCEGKYDPAELDRLLVDACMATPVGGLVRGEKISLFTLTHNRQRIDTGALVALDGPALPDPGDPIATIARPGLGDAPILAEKTASEEDIARRIAGDPPRAPAMDGTKKLLHLRTTCRANADGTYRCLREQYAQVSSSWEFTVDDRAEGAVAPDSASYFAIGVAFCFMTQIGRFAHMAKHPLSAYRVVQDMHATLGGASGDTGSAGDIDPVETHVFMDSGAGDETAQDIVRVAERTCFLHALCRDRAKIRVLPVSRNSG